MGQNFERKLMHALNRFFENHRFVDSKGLPQGVAFRDTQYKYTSQKLDVFVDNPSLGIECKKVKFSSSKKLYFSQHFSEKQVDGEARHQVENISDFLFRSGRKGFLAVRVSMGRGKPAKGYFVDWDYVRDLYEDGDVAGLDLRRLDDLAENHSYVIRIPRESGEWRISEDVWSRLMVLR